MQIYLFFFNKNNFETKKFYLALHQSKYMLQRIQTIFMLFAFLANGYISFTAISKYFAVSEVQVLVAGILSILTFLFILKSIFSFKNRQNQFVLNRLSIIFNFIILGLFLYRSLNLSGDAVVSMKDIEIFLALISIVLLVFANKFIKKDEDLVKSVDRIR